MKSKQQILDRITGLELRGKDDIQVGDTVKMLNWALISTEADILEELVNSITNPWKLPFQYIRNMLWILED